MTTAPTTPPQRVLAGDAGLYCSGEESLRVTSLNSVASVVLALGGRFLQLGDATPKALQERHVPNSDRTAATSDHALGEGWLQHLTLVATGAAPTIGAAFARVDLIRGRGASATVVGTLLQGFVTAGQRLAWPGSTMRSSVEGAGVLRSILGTDPAANVEISETVPTGARWRVLAMRFALVTDANAANREVAVTFDDGAAVYAEFPSGANQAASLTRNYTASPSNVRGAAATGTGILIATADLLLPAGHRIATVTTNRQAGDNFGAPQLLVEEWLEGA